MAVREILLPLVSYPVTVEEAAIRKSVSVAAHLNARILAVSSPPPDRNLTRAFSTGRLPTEAPEHETSAKNAEQMMVVLDAAARAAGVECRKTISRCAPEEFSSYLASGPPTFHWSRSDRTKKCMKKWSKD